jgi:hypothetical protein
MTAVKRTNFTLTFEAEGLKDLEQQVLAVDLGTEIFNEVGGTQHRTNTLIVWFADDDANLAMKAVRAWVKNENKQFTLTVKIFAEKDVKDIYVFEHCQLNALQHSIFSIEDQDERLEVQLGSHKYISHVGKIKPPVARESSAKLLQIAFAKMDHHITDNIQ